MSGPDNISKLDRLRARDGGNCWLCGAPIDFEAEPNSAKAWLASIRGQIREVLGS